MVFFILSSALQTIARRRPRKAQAASGRRLK